jgi:hypothetical protein
MHSKTSGGNNEVSIILALLTSDAVGIALSTSYIGDIRPRTTQGAWLLPY